MFTYETTFEHASLWAIIWRIALATLGVIILGAMLLVAFMGEHVTMIGLLTDGLIYFILYKITISQMKKQSLSVAALSSPYEKTVSPLIRVAGWTILTAVVASLFVYFFVSVLTFIPTLFDRIVPYVLELTGSEDLPVFYLFIVAVIFAPVVEEIVFRGYLLNKWVDKYGVNKGIIFSSVVFMAIHLQSLFIPQLLVGLVCGVIYVKYNNLIYPIIAHALYNLLVILPLFLAPSVSIADAQAEFLMLRDGLPTEYVVYSALFILSLIFLLWLLRREWKSLRNSDSPYAQNIHSIE
ncbi:CPBP family intramembrane glutamic endopeptidase [Alkalibacterium thalassium]|uniref:CAAX protease self-immunity n=1 Tax=Alkalibacterium thalassium TaxID=426701 RepID=A0A1G9EB70_9LACT|nr:CPBP family intramembrane glutamic endopeptidase [Alkalibacterium thalassium]SDK73410.1 CAAX protease self-immunity [Alkalibacterium thalassium]